MQSDAAFNYFLLNTALARFSRPPGQLDGRELASARADTQRQWAVHECILAAPEARDVVVDETVVRDAVATVERRYGGVEEFEADLERNRLDRRTLGRALARELKVDAVIQVLSAGACKVSGQELEIYHLQHRERFRAPETRVVRHVLITVNAGFEENTRRAARRRIEKVAAEAAAHPERFADLALRHSECPSAMQGGLIGRVGRGKLYPELDEVLFRMEEGAVSGPLESEMGFHVLLCERVVPEGPLPLDLVRDKIEEVIAERKRKLFLRDYLRQNMPASADAAASR